MGIADLRLLIVDWLDVGLQFNTRASISMQQFSNSISIQHSAFINQQF